jgi:hypothetical protein
VGVAVYSLYDVAMCVCGRELDVEVDVMCDKRMARARERERERTSTLACEDNSYNSVRHNTNQATRDTTIEPTVIVNQPLSEEQSIQSDNA